MSVEVISGGLASSVQDAGRFGYQSMGIGTAGAMDDFSFRVANALLGNPLEHPVVEFAVLGPTVRFLRRAAFVVCGGECEPKLDGVPVPTWEVAVADEGAVLEIGPISRGVFGYLGLGGLISVPPVMGSRSTDVKARLGGVGGRFLKAGDVLPLEVDERCFARVGMRPAREVLPSFGEEVSVSFTWGTEEDRFEPEARGLFVESSWTVTEKSDRMGYRLDGPPLRHGPRGADIISDGIALGSVQVPGDGKPIVLLKDRQTVGGYTKIGTVVWAHLPRLVQVRPGGRVRFEPVDLECALEERRRFWRLLHHLPLESRRRWAFRISIDGKSFNAFVEEA